MYLMLTEQTVRCLSVWILFGWSGRWAAYRNQDWVVVSRYFW